MTLKNMQQIREKLAPHTTSAQQLANVSMSWKILKKAAKESMSVAGAGPTKGKAGSTKLWHVLTRILELTVDFLVRKST